MAEIRVQDEQGVIHVFPDGSTPDMIANVMNVKPPDAMQQQPAQPKGVGDQLADFGKSLWQQINPVSGLKGMAQATSHPAQTFNADVNARQQVLDKAHEELSKGNYADGAAYWLYAHVPLIGAQLAHAGESFKKGDIGAGAGESTGIGLNLVGPSALKDVHIPIKVPALPTVAERMYQSALKPSTTIPAIQRESLVKTGLNAEIPISPAGAGKLSGLIDDLNSKISQQIAAGGPKPLLRPPVKGLLPAAPTEIAIPGSDPNMVGTVEAPHSPRAVLQRPALPGGPISYFDSGTTINPQDVVKRLDSVKARFANQVNPEADLQAIDAAKAEFLKNNPDAIPAAQAQAMKQGTYQQLKGRAYGELKGATIESQKALARGIKEELETQFPEIKGLNAQESQFIGLDRALDKALNRIGNHQLIGIGTPIVGGATGAVAGGPAAIASMIMKAAIDDPVVKSRLAIALNKAGRGSIPINAAASRIAGYANSLGNAQQQNAQQ